MKWDLRRNRRVPVCEDADADCGLLALRGHPKIKFSTSLQGGGGQLFPVHSTKHRATWVRTV